MQPKNIRIKDIASLAGVSEGTVDRVLHKRGKVSRLALEKVTKVLKEINYKPNLIARTLGSNRTYRIATLTPDPDLDPFWKQSQDGIQAGETQLAQLGIQVVIEPSFYNPHDKESFQKAALHVYHSFPDGVIVAPLFYYAALPFLKGLADKKIPFILFNTHLEEVDALTFIGQDLYQSGRLAAELVSMGFPESADFLILHIDEDLSNSVHLKEKERGFRSFFHEKENFEGSINTLVLDNPFTASFQYQLKEALANPTLTGVFVSTSKAYTVASRIKSKNSSIRIVGYDLIKANHEALEAGHLDFIINQNPMRQAKLGVQTMANHLLFQKNIPSIHHFPLEIITAQNVSSYLSHPGFQSGIMM